MHLIYKIIGISICSLAFGYYGKIEPIESYNIKSDINGKVIEVNKTAEATNYKGVVIKIDKYQDEVNLKNLKNQLNNFNLILDSQKQILKKKKGIFETYNRLDSKSKFEKDLKFLDYQNSLILVNQTKNTISNLKAQIEVLKDKISATSIIVTHDIDLMEKVSDRVALLREGKIIFIGKKGEISDETLEYLYSIGDTYEI